MDTYGGEQDQPLTLNRYIYASDDPVNNVDPTGKLAFPIDLAIDGLIATGFAANAGLPGSFAAALLVKTLLNPFEPLLTALLYRAPWRYRSTTWGTRSTIWHRPSQGS